MSRIEKSRRVDDLDGSDATQTVRFGLGDERFEIDLSDPNARALRTIFEPYIAAGRPARPAADSGGRRQATHRRPSGAPRPPRRTTAPVAPEAGSRAAEERPSELAPVVSLASRRRARALAVDTTAQIRELAARIVAAIRELAGSAASALVAQLIALFDRLDELLRPTPTRRPTGSRLPERPSTVPAG